MRWLVGILLVLFFLLQYQLWFGHGGYLELRELRATVAEQEAEIERLKERNEALAAEVKNLKKGLDAVEERARGELGMVRDGEVFYQVIEKDKPQ